MIRSVTVLPSPPLLLPEYAGRDDAGAALRQGCVELLGPLTGGSAVLVVATDRDPRSTRPALGRRVGELLLGLAGVSVEDVVEVAWDAPTERCRATGEALAADPRALDLVVVADGCARRSEKAPGHLDERSFGFDEALLEALRAGDPVGLLALDAGLAAELLAQGRAPLQVAAGAMSGSVAADETADEASAADEMAGPIADGAVATDETADEASAAGAAPGRPAYRCVSLDHSDPFGVLYVLARLER